MTATTKTDRISAEMLEMAVLLSKHKVLSAQDLGQIKALCSPPPVYPSERVAQIRIQKAKMSQTVFAGFLHVRPSTVQKWECPTSGKHPVGAAAKLLQLILFHSRHSLIDKKGEENAFLKRLPIYGLMFFCSLYKAFTGPKRAPQVL